MLLISRVNKIDNDIIRFLLSRNMKANVGNGQEMVQSERNSHSINRGGKNQNQVLKLSTHCKLFLNRRSLSYPNLTINYKNAHMVISFKHHKNSTLKRK